jgi:hypothetical protein
VTEGEGQRDRGRRAEGRGWRAEGQRAEGHWAEGGQTENGGWRMEGGWRQNPYLQSREFFAQLLTEFAASGSKWTSKPLLPVPILPIQLTPLPPEEGYGFFSLNWATHEFMELGSVALSSFWLLKSKKSFCKHVQLVPELKIKVGVLNLKNNLQTFTCHLIQRTQHQRTGNRSCGLSNWQSASTHWPQRCQALIHKLGLLCTFHRVN